MTLLLLLLAQALCAPQIGSVASNGTRPNAPTTPTSGSAPVAAALPAQPAGPPNTDGPGPEFVGNCLTQKIDFTDPSRIFAMDGLPSLTDIKELDTARYDMTIDYHSDLVSVSGNGGVVFTAKNSADPQKLNALAPRMSTTRFIRYGKFSAMLSAPAVKGIVTTFVGMGPNLPDSSLNLASTDKNSGDEIDWEIVGGEPYKAESNIFYRGFKDYSLRGGKHNVDVTEKHLYTIDWKRESIAFLIDNKLVRTYYKNQSTANPTREQDPSQLHRFFPNRAMKVQFAMWSDITNNWAGGIPEFPAGQNSATATYDFVDIQCYNDKDEPVPQWPLENNPARKESLPNQPTRGINGKRIF
jgi:Glycosyl hydrolases family 16